MKGSQWIECGAQFSPDRNYRYNLWRTWSSGPKVCWCMLNPSTADELVNDPSVERCERRSRVWGYGGLIVVNLFAIRSTDPKGIRMVPDPVGPDNDSAILGAARAAQATICAWGNHGSYHGRSKGVLALLDGINTYALDVTGKGEPGHPLYLPYGITPLAFPAGKPEWVKPMLCEPYLLAEELFSSQG